MQGQMPRSGLSSYNPVAPARRRYFAAGGEASGGQDDDVPAMLSEGEYVIPADVVAHLGDGNQESGYSILDQLVGNIRKQKGAPNKLPPKSKPVESYIRGIGGQ